jgi:hypothetical protein
MHADGTNGRRRFSPAVRVIAQHKAIFASSTFLLSRRDDLYGLASKDKLQAALNKIGASPLKYVVNTHWHRDHTDGNEWMHAAGPTIIAQRNTLKHLSETTRIDDWNWTFAPVPAGARPTIIVENERHSLLRATP